jgi:hypothetical protein
VKKHDIGHQRFSPSIPVGQHTEENRPDGTHRQGGGRCPNDFGGRNMKLRREHVDQEDKDKEIKCVKSPTPENPH